MKPRPGRSWPGKPPRSPEASCVIQRRLASQARGIKRQERGLGWGVKGTQLAEGPAGIYLTGCWAQISNLRQKVLWSGQDSKDIP